MCVSEAVINCRPMDISMTPAWPQPDPSTAAMGPALGGWMEPILRVKIRRGTIDLVSYLVMNGQI